MGYAEFYIFYFEEFNFGIEHSVSSAKNICTVNILFSELGNSYLDNNLPFLMIS